MSDPVSQELFFATIEQLRRDTGEHHARLRETMTDGFRELAAKLDDHMKDDRLVADRVLTIETQREGEQAQAIKRGTWAGLSAATGVTILMELWRRWMGPG